MNINNYRDRLRQMYSLYQENKDLISIGAYSQGTDPRIDQAIDLQPVIQVFLTAKNFRNYSL